MSVETIGIIAGNGRFPFLVAEEVRKAGKRVAVIGLREETDPAIEKLADVMTWVHLGEFQKMIDQIHASGAVNVIMAGQVKHAQIFAGLKLDWRAIKLMGSLINKKTDTILGTVANEFQKEGISLLPSHHYLKSLLPKAGLICGKKLDGEEKKVAEFGHKIAKQIAGMDIGQTVVVKDRSVVAVESIEGTDECIRRAAQFAGVGVIVVKVAKPNQDWRFDVPVIGLRTVSTLAECKARAMIIEAGATLLIDKDKLVDEAGKAGVTIIAVNS